MIATLKQKQKQESSSSPSLSHSLQFTNTLSDRSSGMEPPLQDRPIPVACDDILKCIKDLAIDEEFERGLMRKQESLIASETWVT